MCQEMLAGLKCIQVYCNDTERDKALKVFPAAEFDSATTKSIELLPRQVKDKIFDLVVEKQKIDVMDEFMKNY